MAIDDEMPAWAVAMEGRLQTSSTQLRAALMERMDRLQNSISLIRDDIAVNFGATDAVKRANDNTCEELRSLGDLVMGMNRQIQRLQTDIRELRGDP